MKHVEIDYILDGQQLKHRDDLNRGKYIGMIAHCIEKGKKRIRAEYTILGNTEIEKDDARAAYFAYLNRLVKDGHEQWTDSIPGRSIAAKVSALDYCMRGKWCEMNPEYYTVIPLYLPGEKKRMIKREIFTISRETKLLPEQLKAYYNFAKEELMKAHKTFTAQFGGEAWTIPYWIES